MTKPFSKLAGCSILVTGHSGFKGSWLSLILSKLDCVLSGFALPPESNALFSRLKIPITNHFADIRDLAAVERCIAQHKPKLIFHLAAQAVVSQGYKDPVGTFSTNIMGLVHVLEAARRHGVDSVVVISTDKVYRAQTQKCTTDFPLEGTDPYAASKVAAEAIIHAYKKDLNISVARSGNAVGGGDWGVDRLIPDVMRAKQKGHVLYLRHPQSVRPWIHVIELVYGYLLLAEQTLKGANLICNFGSQKQLSVENIIQFFTAKDSSLRTDIQSSSFVENMHLLLDCSQTHSLLGWSNQLTSAQMLEYVWEEYAHLDSVDSTGFEKLMYQRFQGLLTI